LATAPRPRDARTIELLLTAQGVTSFEQRVPLLLLDFAYRHTASILSDALHLSADPYTSHAGARPSAASGAAPVNVGEATISTNAVQLAIASRLGFQFRGGAGGGTGGTGGGGASKDWMMELARETNKVALPRVMPSEWGVRLPSERFVLSGVSWGLRDVWAGQEGLEESSEDDEDENEEMMVDGPGAGTGPDAMETEDVGGDGVEGGTIGDVFGDEGMEDEEMAEA
jgi:transcription initiation factor TFIID subunit 9B